MPLDGVDFASPRLTSLLADAFHARHAELYTYAMPDQEAVLVNARVAVVGGLPALPREPDLPHRLPSSPRSKRRIHLGRWHDVDVYDLEALAPGQVIEGPAIVESATTTVLLRHGDRATVTGFGWLDVTVG